MAYPAISCPNLNKCPAPRVGQAGRRSGGSRHSHSQADGRECGVTTARPNLQAPAWLQHIRSTELHISSQACAHLNKRPHQDRASRTAVGQIEPADSRATRRPGPRGRVAAATPPTPRRGRRGRGRDPSSSRAASPYLHEGETEWRASCQSAKSERTRSRFFDMARAVSRRTSASHAMVRRRPAWP